jgi:hypothetical protein
MRHERGTPRSDTLGRVYVTLVWVITIVIIAVHVVILTRVWAVRFTERIRVVVRLMWSAAVW